MAEPPLSLKRLGRALAEVVLPPACLACGGPLESGQILCPSCALQVNYLEGALCPCCGRPGPGPCRSCAEAAPAFDRARAVAWYEGPLGQAVRDFKYRRRAWQGRGLGRVLAARGPAELLAEVDIIAPVPLHPLRLMGRGFNQSLILARAVGRQSRAELAPALLRRLRHTRPQAGLDPGQRLANVAGAFGVSRLWAGRLKGKRVLVVDDVFTTGATVNECARALKAAGASAVDILTLVRAGSRREPRQPKGPHAIP